MTTSSRLRGNVLPIFTLKLGVAAAVSYADDCKKIGLTSDAKPDSDLTFAEAAAGLGRDFTVKVETIVSFDAGSLFAFAWTNKGASVVVTWGPWGNATPTATKPHFQLMCTLPTPDVETEARTTVEGAATTLELVGTSAVTTLIA